MIRGVDAIIEILNDFLKEFDCYARLDTDFCYYCTEECIGVAFATSDFSDRVFLAYIQDTYPEIMVAAPNVTIWLVSFLHELGHHMTFDNLEDIEISYSFDMKSQLMAKGTVEEDDDARWVRNMTYFKLPDEAAATKWAIEYILFHKEKIQDLIDKLNPAIQYFIEVNNIES